MKVKRTQFLFLNQISVGQCVEVVLFEPNLSCFECILVKEQTHTSLVLRPDVFVEISYVIVVSHSIVQDVDSLDHLIIF